jgi:hypothetical protein
MPDTRKYAGTEKARTEGKENQKTEKDWNEKSEEIEDNLLKCQNIRRIELKCSVKMDVHH